MLSCSQACWDMSAVIGFGQRLCSNRLNVRVFISYGRVVKESIVIKLSIMKRKSVL
jgi:hypothetical protein